MLYFLSFITEQVVLFHLHQNSIHCLRLPQHNLVFASASALKILSPLSTPRVSKTKYYLWFEARELRNFPKSIDDSLGVSKLMRQYHVVRVCQPEKTLTAPAAPKNFKNQLREKDPKALPFRRL